MTKIRSWGAAGAEFPGGGCWGEHHKHGMLRVRLLLLPQALLPEGSKGEGEVSSHPSLTVGSALSGLSQQLFILLCVCEIKAPQPTPALSAGQEIWILGIIFPLQKFSPFASPPSTPFPSAQSSILQPPGAHLGCSDTSPMSLSLRGTQRGSLRSVCAATRENPSAGGTGGSRGWEGL